jgi:hypothetical protein
MLNTRNSRGRIRTVSRINEARMKAGLPELGISLRKRRTWWADDDDSDDDGGSGSDSKYNPKDMAEAKKIIASLTKRVDERDATISELKSGQESLETRIQAMESAARQRSEESGDYKKLYEEQLAEVERLKPIAERGKGAIETIRGSNDARIANIPETMRTAVPTDYPPEKLQTWLNANESWLTREPAPNYDGGTGGTGDDNAKPKLSPEDREAMALMGLSEEDMLKAKGDE